MRVRGSAGAGGVCQRRGDRRLWGAERGEALPGWARGARPGKAAPGLKLDAYLQVTTAERFTHYLSAIRLQSALRDLRPGAVRKQGQPKPTEVGAPGAVSGCAPSRV